jgi:cytochrome oxidase Cu insertion factor (SCO1/SenC/PrrC family)
MRQKTETTEKNRLRASRLKLLLVFSLFLGPLLVAFLWYYGFGARLAPQGQSNHSPLITPAVPLQQFENPAYSGKPVNNTFLKKKWTIVHIVGDSCSESCRKALYNTRQARLAIGKDTNRVQRLIVLSGSVLASEVAANHPDATLVRASDEGIGTLLRSISILFQVGEYDALVVDPLGNLMMSIPLEQDPGLLVKDLKKLLKLSRIG